MINGEKSIDRVLRALKASGLPAAYSHFDTKIDPPFVVYYGSGQDTMSADNTRFWHDNSYNVEYYFNDKDVENEEELEAAFIAEGFQFEKSEDTYLDDEDVFVIYYYL